MFQRLDDLQSLPVVESDDYEQFIFGTYDNFVELVKEYILDIVEEFNPKFLAYHSCLNEKAIRLLQQHSCTDGLKDTISDLDHFVDDAISVDGLGHFLHFTKEDSEQRFNEFWDRLDDEERTNIKPIIEQIKKELTIFEDYKIVMFELE